MSNSTVTTHAQSGIQDGLDTGSSYLRLLQDNELDAVGGGDGTVCLVSATPPTTIIVRKG